MRLLRPLGAVAAAAGIFGLAIPASAAGATTKAEAARAALISALQHSVQRAERPASTSSSSYNWSGYADLNTSGEVYSSVSSAWRQPTISCRTKEDQIAVFWVGMDGWTSSTVEQAGTLAQCYLGTAYYYTWWEMYPTNSVQVVGSTVKPGDKITASVKYAAGKYNLTVTDATTSGNNVSTKQACGSGLTCSNSSAEWIAEAPGGARGEYPLPDYVKWTPTGAKVSTTTTTGTISTFPDTSIAMVDSTNSYDLASVGSLLSGGKSFVDTWDNSY
jgi:hypothetical protein